ncbi:MAG TPA: hypothetical protein PKX92_01425 [Edaphocola sp.]|nr:hypothetical protein [Edaphocola sp.]
MKIFFNKLYCNYYHFQERVGNRDVAPITSALLIAFILMLYYFSLSFFVMFLLLPKAGISVDMSLFKAVSFSVGILLVVGILFFYLYKKKYKKILLNCDNTPNKVMAILFPLIAFILFNVSWILKMLQNQGKF